MENLMGLGSNIQAGASYHKRKARKAFIPIVREAQKLLRASVCSLYLLDRYGETVELMTTTDPDLERLQKQGKYISYVRGKGLIGWIFKTGRPLLVNETPSLMNRRLLSDQELLHYSDTAEINDEDRSIQAEASELRLHANPFVHFVGVPLLSSGGKTQGVLVVLSDTKGKQFSLSDLKLLQNFAIS